MAALVDLVQLYPAIQLVILLLVSILLSHLTNYFLSRIFLGRTYRWLVAPGIIVHEYAHATGCLLTGTRIRQIKVFESSGGRVVHEEPRWPLAQAIISLAPLFGAMGLIYLAATLLMPGLTSGGGINFDGSQLIFIYVAFSVAATMAPSWQDLRVGALSLLIWLAFLILLSVSPMAQEYFSWLAGGSLEGFLRVWYFTVAVGAVTTAVSGLVFVALHQRRPAGTKYHAIE